jgi:hypothetical protein
MQGVIEIIVRMFKEEGPAIIAEKMEVLVVARIE